MEDTEIKFYVLQAMCTSKIMTLNELKKDHFILNATQDVHERLEEQVLDLERLGLIQYVGFDARANQPSFSITNEGLTGYLRHKAAIKESLKIKQTVPLNIFFSYSRVDYDHAAIFADEAKKLGHSVWIDQRSINTGTRWDLAIEKAIGDCHVFVIILSPTSVISDNVLDELNFAWDKRKLMIPIKVKECILPLRLNRVQFLDYLKSPKHAMSNFVTVLTETWDLDLS